MMADPTYHYPPHPIQRKPAPNLRPGDPASRPAPDVPFAPIYSHSRTRTSSSSALPAASAQTPRISYPPSPIYSQPLHPARRTPSTNTFSTSTSYPPPSPIQRSTSSRSGSSTSSPTSYVALLRKQKATVWCDRAQHEDPRFLAAQRAAKARAHLEVLGGIDSARSLTGLSTTQSGIIGSNRVTAKIRHHGKAGLVGYAPDNFGVGVGGVPMRLSATEVEGGDSDGEDAVAPGAAAAAAVRHHRRTSSEKSSLSSSRRGVRQSGSGARYSAGGTPPLSSGTPRDSAGEFEGLTTTAAATAAAAVADGRGGADAGSLASGSSAERGDAVGDLPSQPSQPSQVDNNNAARMASNALLRGAMGKVTRERSVRNPEELRRRGSVDERTMTMSAQRLYIANPDEDSD